MIDTSRLHRRYLELGALAWLACGAEPGAAQIAGTVPQHEFMIEAMPADCAPGVTFGKGAGVVSGHGAHVAASGVMAGGTSRVVTDSPYSAVGRSETVTTLAGGNRIVRSNTIRYFRDRRGRTRTEYTLSSLGPIALDAARTIVIIDDPTTSKRVVLHPDLKLVTETPRIVCRQAPAGERAGVGAVAMPYAAESAANAPDTPSIAPAPLRALRTDQLAERTISGLRAIGRRTEYSIPAGELGNELPITVTSEIWYSPDLQIVLAATHRDPLAGDTTYQLENVVRREPDAKLFVIPRDYSKRTRPPFDPRLTEPPVETDALPVPTLRPKAGAVVSPKPKRSD